MLRKQDRTVTSTMMSILERGMNYEKNRATLLAAIGGLIKAHEDLLQKAKRVQRELAAESTEIPQRQPKRRRPAGTRKMRRRASRSRSDSPGSVLELMDKAMRSIPSSAPVSLILKRMKELGFTTKSKNPEAMLRVYLGNYPDKFKRVEKGLYELNEKKKG